MNQPCMANGADGSCMHVCTCAAHVEQGDWVSRVCACVVQLVAWRLFTDSIVWSGSLPAGCCRGLDTFLYTYPDTLRCHVVAAGCRVTSDKVLVHLCALNSRAFQALSIYCTVEWPKLCCAKEGYGSHCATVAWCCQGLARNISHPVSQCVKSTKCVTMVPYSTLLKQQTSKEAMHRKMPSNVRVYNRMYVYANECRPSHADPAACAASKFKGNKGSNQSDATDESPPG
jgi:hypothetical protein